MNEINSAMRSVSRIMLGTPFFSLISDHKLP
ncbi:MAG: hypothetical protein JWN15_3366 [Firmicutes bacterium]|nr:hypothetical protein [Bacillota bacterium]